MYAFHQADNLIVNMALYFSFHGVHVSGIKLNYKPTTKIFIP
jgi:hypothetical protein